MTAKHDRDGILGAKFVVKWGGCYLAPARWTYDRARAIRYATRAEAEAALIDVMPAAFYPPRVVRLLPRQGR